jgi:hypothetical protein
MMWTVNQHCKSFSITVEYPTRTNQFLFHALGMCSLFNNKGAYFCEKVEFIMLNSQYNAMSEILKCLSVATKTETSGLIKINWMTSKIIKNEWFWGQTVLQWSPLTARSVTGLLYFLNCWVRTDFSDSGRGVGFVTCNLMIRQVILIKVVLVPFYPVNED